MTVMSGGAKGAEKGAAGRAGGGGIFRETADMCENSCFFPQKMGSGIVAPIWQLFWALVLS